MKRNLSCSYLTTLIESESFGFVWMWFTISGGSGGGSYEAVTLCEVKGALIFLVSAVVYLKSSTQEEASFCVTFKKLQCYFSDTSPEWVTGMTFYTKQFQVWRKRFDPKLFHSCWKQPQDNSYSQPSRNNKTAELIGFYLLNMNLGSRWCCTDVISRLLKDNGCRAEGFNAGEGRDKCPLIYGWGISRG